MGSNGFKNTLHILIFLIFNSFLAQNTKQTVNGKKVVSDTIAVKTDSLKSDSLLKTEKIADVVKTKADNNKSDVPKKMTILNKNATVVYQDTQIDADYISIDWDKNQIFARGKLNEKGKIVSPVITTQGGKKYETESLNYNYKTNKAIAYNTRTEESEGAIVANKTKKANDSIYYLRQGKYTTDEYFLKKKDSMSDYYLLAPKIKMIKGKESSRVITGPIQMYIENVPTPLVLPFAILPFSEKRSAGILIPSFGEREDVGFFLNGLGYYQPIGEHFDLKILSDIYTKGSWNLRPEIGYKKNYRYTGNFIAEFGSRVVGIKGLDNYSQSSTYRIGWRHSQDTKANPYFNFSASVDIVSTKFYNNTLNNNYIFQGNALNTQQSSSISFTKRFLNLPVTINGTASYSQNFATGLVDLRLPQLTVNVNQFYLFKPKTGVRTGLLENINVNTNLSFTNYVNAKQDELFTKAMFDKMQTGLQNTIGLTTNTPLFKYFTFSLSANVNNVMTTKTLDRNYNPVTDKIDNNYKKNISGFSTFTTSASLQTVLYGMLTFNKNSKVQAIRHMVTPSISFNYAPDFSAQSWGYYNEYYDRTGMLVPYSIFEGGIYGSPGTGLTQSIGFNINNSLEMKVKSKKDSTGVEKVKIFENLNISGNYNFAAPKYKWSMININTQSSFFKNKLNVNMSMMLDPYKTEFLPGVEQGIRTEKFGAFSIANFNAQLSLPLSEAILGESKDPAKEYKSKGEIRYENYYFDDNYYARFKQPWTLNVNAQYSYNKGLTRTGTKTFSVGLDGSIKLTPYWNINGSTYYDVVTGQLAYTRIGFSRDQRSFTINFNWVPTGGPYKVYDFFIGIKANILRDAVKYKSRSFPNTTSSF
ncbi:TPA: putative LPS assembly protein LptD [Elizabethkingia anophelis]|uniref:putative LPS assembly protein LptD n=1 Tax=Elizabethkingia TaxID=308865 RepID=UPI001623350B|nr:MULTISPECIES: putative LPS assembly protein LptD [Elizabethkingia]MCT3674225.1 LPS-assembly protein LptD [Elizabethkingia anophelis]MCT3681603.1 LPS-assembly protein LptD [Elizabethkingia anophelis]MCT3701669.1 LPS-assembly protein LptD [Elizabethkingia anophelis]MCT3770716.1 LPS-assembly protein LptD [Elizabethkingia anophelis]MCT3781004.1 LPS-assembly protein LptD [Elizabethkingia anophelis]